MPETKRKLLKQYTVKSLRSYDIFYDIHGEMATITIMGKNVEDAKKRFRSMCGNFKITNVQPLGH
jgi:hypothetical protein